MANFPNFPTLLNATLESNYQSQEDFFKCLPKIAPKLLVHFLEQINSNNCAAIPVTFIERIVTYLNTQALEGTLTLRLAQRISACIQLHNVNSNSIFTPIPSLPQATSKGLLSYLPHQLEQVLKINKSDNSNNNKVSAHSSIKDPQIQLCCQTDDTKDPPFFISKMLLTSSSPFVQRMLKGQFRENVQNKINLPPEIKKDTRRHLKEFLETGKIDQSTKPLSSSQLADLIGLATRWQITELLNYLSNFINVNDENFVDLLNCAVEIKALDLFKTCLKSQFEIEEMTIDINDFDDLTIKIYDLNSKNEVKLEQMGQFLKQVQQNPLFPALKDLKMIPEKHFYYLNGPKLSYPQSLKDAITSFNILNADVIPRKALITLALSCKNLRSILLPTIYNVWQLKELQEVVEACVPHCPHLQSLSLHFRHDVKTEDIRVLSNYPQVTQLITSLNFARSQITNQDLHFLAPLCPNLQKLDLTFCHEITDVGLKAIAEHCPNLESLKLNYCSKINIEQLIEFLAQRCSKLSLLDLSDACTEAMTDELLEKLIKGCSNLKMLYINGNQMTDKGMQAIAKHCPNLTVLILKEATQITNKGIKALALGCPDLVTFELHHCHHLTGEGLRVLAKECSKLKWIDLSGCIKVEEADLFVLAESCPKLNQLKLKWWKHSSTSFKKELETTYPNLKVELE